MTAMISFYESMTFWTLSSCLKFSLGLKKTRKKRQEKIAKKKTIFREGAKMNETGTRSCRKLCGPETPVDYLSNGQKGGEF